MYYYSGLYILMYYLLRRAYIYNNVYRALTAVHSHLTLIVDSCFKP